MCEENDKNIPEGYKCTLPFDRFGFSGHSYYNPDHNNKHGHYCWDWDGLWICEDCEEFKSCTCFKNLELTEQDIAWLDEIVPRLNRIREICAKTGFTFEMKFVSDNTCASKKPIEIDISLDKGRNYSQMTKENY